MIDKRVNESCQSFKQITKDMWGEKTYKNMIITCKKLKSNPAVYYKNKKGIYRTHMVAAVGRSCGKNGFCKEYTLFLTPYSLSLPDDDRDAILRHEAIHIKIPAHRKNFKTVAKKEDAPLTGDAAHMIATKHKIKKALGL